MVSDNINPEEEHIYTLYMANISVVILMWEEELCFGSM